jgi:SAM-dependent methyltransferase
MMSLKEMAKRRLRQMLHVYTDDDVGGQLVDNLGHRAYVGGFWEAIGRLQFKFMIEQGLEPQHAFFDIACGSLRGGVRFIPYLEPRCYLGLDIKQELIDIGIKHELGEKLFALKKPEFVVSDSFEFNRFSKQPDFALAQSLFTHLTESDILLCLKNLREVAKPGTRFYVTFFETDDPVKNPVRSDPHAGFAYTQKQMSEFGDAHGWVARYIGDWNHPRQQRMLEYCIKP